MDYTYDGLQGWTQLHCRIDWTIQASILNVKDNSGRTAFMLACSNGHKDVVQLLRDNFDWFSTTVFRTRNHSQHANESIFVREWLGWQKFLVFTFCRL